MLRRAVSRGCLFEEADTRGPQGQYLACRVVCAVRISMPAGPCRQQQLPDTNEYSMEGFLTMASGSILIRLTCERRGLPKDVGAQHACAASGGCSQ